MPLFTRESGRQRPGDTGCAMGSTSTRRHGVVCKTSVARAAFRCQRVSEPRHRLRNPWGAVGLILAVTLPQFFWGLGDRNIWIPLEARYALVAREMLEGGQWILPHMGGQVYPDKPPIFFWTVALISPF